MKAKDFEALEHRMRVARKRYLQLSEDDVELKREALLTFNQLERELDLADIEDPANLATDLPRAIDPDHEHR